MYTSLESKTILEAWPTGEVVPKPTKYIFHFLHNTALIENKYFPPTIHLFG